MCSLYERLVEIDLSLTRLNVLKCSNDNLVNCAEQSARLLSIVNGLSVENNTEIKLKLSKFTDKMLTNDVINDIKLGENNANNQQSINKKPGKHFKCSWPKCLFKTLDSRQLKDHYSVHQKTQNQFKCDVNNCQKVFKYKRNLIQHKLSHKSNTKGFAQKLQLFGRNSGNYSVAKTGADENVKNGHKLGLIFAHKSNVLLNSMKMTTNIQNNTDLMDGTDSKRVTNNSETKSRTQICRKPKDKRFICDYSGCDKCFDSKSNLERHKRIHSGEKPFGCDIPDCGQRFTQKTHLVQHKKRKHRIILPKNAIKLIKPLDFGLNTDETSVKSVPVLEAIRAPIRSVNSASKSAINSTIQPIANSTPKPAINSTRSRVSSTKTANNSTKIAVNLNKSVADSAKSIVNSTKAVVNTNKTVVITRKLSVRSLANKFTPNSVKTVTNSSEMSLKTELKVNSINEKQYKCYYNKCNKSYDSLYELKTHINGIHTNETLNKCHEINCNEVFKSFYNLYYHKKTFHKLV